MNKLLGNIILFLSLVSVFNLSNAQTSDVRSLNQSDEVEHQQSFMDVDEYNSEMQILDLRERLDDFLEELNDIQIAYTRPFKITRDQRLSRSYMKRLSDDIKSNERKLKSIDLRWNIFYQTEQGHIASNESLMTMVDDLNTIKSAIEDSLQSRQNILQAVIDFNAAERFLSEQDTLYKEFGRKGMELSLTSKTAPQLENLKVREQIIFADIQTHYDKAREATKLFKVSQQEIDNLDNRYASLKNKSAKIQEFAYVPWIQRIKDYLLGFAAVAIIIMFVNMMWSKIKAAKKMKENMKKIQDNLNQNGNNDIPSI